jgi:hypothetical protein
MKQLAQQSEFHTAFKELDSAMSKSRDLFRRLRHQTAGHIDEAAFGKALERISSDTKMLFQAGTTWKNLHYKFCLEFIGAIFLGEAGDHAADEWKRISKVAAKISFQAIKGIDLLFMAYAQQRRLHC